MALPLHIVVRSTAAKLMTDFDALELCVPVICFGAYVVGDIHYHPTLKQFCFDHKRDCFYPYRSRSPQLNYVLKMFSCASDDRFFTGLGFPFSLFLVKHSRIL